MNEETVKNTPNNTSTDSNSSGYKPNFELLPVEEQLEKDDDDIKVEDDGDEGVLRNAHMEESIGSVRRRVRKEQPGGVESADAESDEPEEDPVPFTGQWDLKDMKIVEQVLTEYQSFDVGPFLEALPHKSERQIASYIDYLKGEVPGQANVGFSIKGLVCSAPNRTFKAPSISRRRWKKGSGFSGYRSSKTYTGGTERTAFIEAKRRSLEDMKMNSDQASSLASTASVTGGENTDRLAEWINIINSLQRKRGTIFSEGDFSEALVESWMNLAKIARHFGEKKDYFVGRKLADLQFSNIYTYLGCILKGLDTPVAITSLESAVILHLLEELENKVGNLDKSELEECVQNIGLQFQTGALEYDSSNDFAANSGPDMLSVNPFCLPASLLTPKYKRSPEEERENGIGFVAKDPESIKNESSVIPINI